jgi:hypothetical protein
MRPLEYACERTNVLRTYGYEAAVEVASLDLDHPDVAAQDLALRSIQALEAGQVDRYRAASGSGWCTAFQAEIRVTGQFGQELVNRDGVQPGKALQAQDRDDPFPPLVGPKHRCLELPVGLLFDSLE